MKIIYGFLTYHISGSEEDKVSDPHKTSFYVPALKNRVNYGVIRCIIQFKDIIHNIWCLFVFYFKRYLNKTAPFTCRFALSICDLLVDTNH